MFLFHDSSIALSNSRVALRDLLWSDISAVKLPDGSSPPPLTDVIDAVGSSRITLYVELKSQEAAARLAQTLQEDPRLLLERNLIFISFSLSSLKIMRQRLQPVASFAAPLRLLWLVDNPRIPYPPESLDDGELQFDICSQSFEAFLDANSLRAEFLEVSPEGLGIQCVN